MDIHFLVQKAAAKYAALPIPMLILSYPTYTILSVAAHTDSVLISLPFSQTLRTQFA